MSATDAGDPVDIVDALAAHCEFIDQATFYSPSPFEAMRADMERAIYTINTLRAQVADDQVWVTGAMSGISTVPMEGHSQEFLNGRKQLDFALDSLPTEFIRLFAQEVEVAVRPRPAE